MRTKFLNLLKITFCPLPAARYPLIFISFLLTFGLADLRLSFAEQPDCLMCHEPLSKEPVVHPALQMGCPTCHSAIDAADIPHKITNKIAKGLSSDQPDLCYDCHDKSMFSKKEVHPALGMGCTSCHNPHSSKNSKLLISEPPDLCYNCHDKTKFDGKTVHPPVMGGMCTGCHSPHSSDTGKLLLSKPPALCFNCHDKTTFEKRKQHMPVASGLCLTCHSPHVSANLALLVKPMFDLCISCHKTQASGTHVLAGLRGSHPIKQGTPDPSRQGRDMGCSSCHNPHGSDFDKLFYQQGICKKCHKY
jgi:predicted CXXCH cytochrome family protein